MEELFDVFSRTLMRIGILFFVVHLWLLFVAISNPIENSLELAISGLIFSSYLTIVGVWVKIKR